MSTAQSEAEKRYFEHLCQLLYKTHPVEILRDQLGEAYERCDGLIAGIEYAYVKRREHIGNQAVLSWVPREGINFDPKVKYIEPAQRATSLALSAAYDIGRWLRYSLGEEAGVLETKLRTALDALNFDIRDMPQFMFMERARARWEQNVEELEKLHGTLKTVALRDEYPDTEQTLAQVKALHAALVNVKECMHGLEVDARNSELDRVRCHSHRLRGELLPALANCVAPIASRLQYVLDYDAGQALKVQLDHKNAGKAHADILDVHIATLAKRVGRCEIHLVRWALSDSRKGDSEFPCESERWYTQAAEETCFLVLWLDNVLTAMPEGLKSADTPQTEPSKMILPGTADEAVVFLGDEWATYEQLATVTGKSTASIRGAVARAKKSEKWERMYEEPIPEARPASAHKRFRIRGIWKFLPPVRARAQK